MAKKTAKKRTTARKKAPLEVEYVPIAQLKPFKGNPRKNADAVPEIVRSIEHYGYTNPILVRRENNEVIAGHTRLLALKETGAAEAPVIFLDMTAKQARAYGIFDNKSTENTEWDVPKLATLLEQLSADGIDLDKMGFTDEELAAMQPVTGYEPDPADDQVPDPPKKPISKTGDLWVLGDHRLLCGDAARAVNVKALMGQSRAALMNTDPPYGVAYANDQRPNPGVAKPRVAKPRVANDTLHDEKLQAFLETIFTCACDCALKKNAAWYLWHAHLIQGFFAAAAAAAAADVILHRQIIWVKPVLLLGRGQYHWKHEPCFMGWVKGHSPPDYGLGNGERTQTTVWEIAGVSQTDRKKFNHATTKPVGLFTIPIIKHLKSNEICYEPFAGSGPQFIAAEKLGRRCYGMEIEPKYCDVSIERWQQFTGGKAKRIVGKQTPQTRKRTKKSKKKSA